MASSGIKRDHSQTRQHPEDRLGPSGSGRNDGQDQRSKVKDWRDAFLEDDEPRRGSGSGNGNGLSQKSDRDRGHDRERERNREREKYKDHHRERDRGDSYRRHGDTRDQRSHRDRDHDYAYSRDRRDRDREGHGSARERERDRPQSRSRSRSRERKHARRDSGPRVERETEEGEIASPSPSNAGLPYSETTSRPSLPQKTNGQAQPPLRQSLSPRKPFQPIATPTGPRSRIPQSRAPELSAFNPLGSHDKPRSSLPEAQPAATEPITVIEEEVDPEKVVEERRKKREEIMARFKAQGRRELASERATPVPEALGTGTESVTSNGTKTGHLTTGATPLLKHLGTRSVSLLPGNVLTPSNVHEPSLASTPLGHDFDLAKQEASAGDALPDAVEEDAVAADMLISAADYDPTQEGNVDREKRMKDMEGAKVNAVAVANGIGEPVIEVIEDEWEEVEIEVDDEDEDLDMFAGFGDDGGDKKKKKVTVRRLKAGSKGAAAGGGAGYEVVKKSNKEAVLDIVDNADDTDGYYRITPGEILDDGRYQVTITLGKGMFSAVVKAKVLKAVDQERRQDVVGKEVAIKVIRSQESMYVAGRKEAGILKKLNDADPEDKKHIVRLERTFEHRGHLCIVTESLSMNLRDVIKRFGKDVGLNMRAVRAYAHQLFLALSLMRKCSVVHADIKPDNVLVSENKATLKVCDLGSASDVSEGEITPYLVSRFYRAPEIILGLPYDTAIDIWSVGCTLYELYTGKILFPGRSNNHMLLLMMEVKGKFNNRLIKKASLGEMHFDESMNFISIEKDKITGADVVKTLVINKASRDLRSRLLPSSSVQVKMKEDELKQMTNFVDLLDKCLQLDPARRLTPRDALMHPFLSG